MKKTIAYKLVVHLFLLAFSFLLFYSVSHMVHFHQINGTNTEFTGTYEFEERFCKYIERVAAYVQYREQGYEPRYNVSNVLGNAVSGNTFHLMEESSEQSSFEFYNNKLNIEKTNFLYYVKNTGTGTVYASPTLEEMYQTALKTNSIEQDTTLEEYMARLIQQNSAYFVLNTAEELYSTTATKYGYIDSPTLDWIVSCITGKLASDQVQQGITQAGADAQIPAGTESTFQNTDVQDIAGNNVNSVLEKKPDAYMIYATVLPDFPYTTDDFSPLYASFQSTVETFQFTKTMLPLSFIGVVLFLILAVMSCGRRNEQGTIVLNHFDRISTEVAVLFSLVFVGFTVYLGTYFCSYVSSIGLFPDSMLWKGVLESFIPFLCFYIPGTACLFSLFRRVKARTFFSNFLLYKIARKLKHWCIRFFQNKNVTYQTAAFLILFLGISVVIGIFCLIGRQGVVIGGILFLIAFFVAALLLLRLSADINVVMTETKLIQDGDLTHKIPDTIRSAPIRKLGEYINNISEGFSEAVDEQLKSERLKTELITNVSHDIKTPLTSIINYVDLLGKEDLHNDTARGYLKILENKSWRLKTLIEDLVEASKASSGAISLHLEKINLIELVRQSCGEFEGKFSERNLTAVLTLPEKPVYILADGRSTFRIIENAFSNVSKYALEGTRVYVDAIETEDKITISVKNISATQLNIDSEELMARFVRGDLSRNTEGSGLGLSIAQSLTKLQDGSFDIVLDGDLFKALITFNKLEEPEKPDPAETLPVDASPVTPVPEQEEPSTASNTDEPSQ
ncbi:HAMP domain-containing sensor histidine kinase [Anaerolentibacter hominis]|uniref:sensor histidine kinase n=1 Tax=Anaerolentibacter hominis TaxID=3079009 RepID=UPI0031B8653C